MGYLQNQGEHHHGVAKYLYVDPPTPSISWQYLVMRFYLSIFLWIKCYIFPPRWNQGFPNHTTLGRFFRPVRAELLILWKRLVGQKRGVQELSYPRLDLCLVKSFLFPNWLIVVGKIPFVYHLKLSPFLSAFWHVMLVSQISATRKMCVVVFSSSLLLL